MSEKLLDTFTFKCSADFKHRLAGIAIAENMDASEFVRRAIESEIEKRRSMYQALHNVFGSPKDNAV